METRELHARTAAPTDPLAFVNEISEWLTKPIAEVDAAYAGEAREILLAGIRGLNDEALIGNQKAFYAQQLLLARIYRLHTLIPDGPTAEGSVVVHEITRLIEDATAHAEDARIEPGLLNEAPEDPHAYLSWLKRLARGHRVFKHAYYHEFIRDQATADDLRTYVMQESVVDGRFDDLLAMMQVGTSGAAKMEIAANFWDEMGNGDLEQVHTLLFNKIFEVFEIPEDELERSLTANALLSGNLAVMLSRYRQFYPEAVGFLGMTEWMVPDRFVQVVHAWERLGLPDIGIVYHRLHITIDSQHAAGWFHNVVVPAAESARMRRAIARGTLWRLNSSARYLDERMPVAAV
ncbi:iron-containing redox enzyme family protein [Streptomyces sp. ISL-43]|uniref:iron-containing redox enzyme family protein n=1 Tax=Streptomyces sp. ISL-43 TaxID=2819183 RepID=UPI001BE659A6|nr:iron-containing redox enzyme family protein [Streptomyces sp. ISL-43]MBT2447839.1 iron-containing redox enzyme family protein [Streptomyces sp. ISL-43]